MAITRKGLKNPNNERVINRYFWDNLRCLNRIHQVVGRLVLAIFNDVNQI